MFCSNQAGNNPSSDYNYTAVLKEYNVKNKSVFAPVKNIINQRHDLRWLR